MKRHLISTLLFLTFAIPSLAQQYRFPEPSSLYIKSYDELKKSTSKTGQYITDKDDTYEVYTNIPESGSAATWVQKSIDSYQMYIPDFKQLRAFESKYWSATLLKNHVLNFYFIRSKGDQLDTMQIAIKNDNSFDTKYTIDSIPFREGTYTIDLANNEFLDVHRNRSGQGVRLDDVIDWETMLYKSINNDGLVEELCDFTAGRRNGRCIGYHSNGKKKYEGEYTYGQKSGYWIFYSEDGSKQKEGPYEDDLEDGEWVFYEKKKTYTKTYENGELVSN